MTTAVVKLEPLPGGRIRVRGGPDRDTEAWIAFAEAARSGGARQDSLLRALVLPPHALATFLSVLQRSGNYQVEVHPDVARAAQQARSEAQVAATAAMERGDVVLAGGRALRDYQKVAAAWLSANKWRGILADAPGVGKTASIIVSWPKHARVVVVCPRVAIGTWSYHVGWRADDFATKPVARRANFMWPTPGVVVIATFERIPSADEFADGTALALSCPEELIVVVDEAHLAKNLFGKRPSKRALAVDALCKLARSKGGGSTIVTGTPLDNWPPDLYAMVKLAGLEERSWRTEAAFYTDFGGDPRGGKQQEWSREGVKDHVPMILRNVMLRREKEEVLPELPDKQWEHITVEVPKDVAAVADEAVEALKKIGLDVSQEHKWGCSCLQCKIDLTVKTRTGSIPFELISRARAALAVAKLPALQELVEVLEAGGDPFLVWCCHTDVLEALVASRAGWALITGDASDVKRKRIEGEFQARKHKGLALTQHEQIGVSITLTAAWRSIHVDMPFKPSTLVQCEDRIHRFGQKNACLYTYLVADHPLDRWLTRLIGRKAGIEAASVRAAAVAGPPESILPPEVPAELVVASADAVRPPRANEQAFVKWMQRQTTGVPALMARALQRQGGMLSEAQWQAAIKASGWARSAS